MVVQTTRVFYGLFFLNSFILCFILLIYQLFLPDKDQLINQKLSHEFFFTLFALIFIPKSFTLKFLGKKQAKIHLPRSLDGTFFMTKRYSMMFLINIQELKYIQRT
jgi:quinol-cytochrome oxidoreductase complex cytochrome b subunit